MKQNSEVQNTLQGLCSLESESEAREPQDQEETFSQEFERVSDALEVLAEDRINRLFKNISLFDKWSKNSEDLEPQGKTKITYLDSVEHGQVVA